MGARRIFSRGRQNQGVWGTEVPQRGPGAEPRWGSGGEAPRSWQHILKTAYSKIGSCYQRPTVLSQVQLYKECHKHEFQHSATVNVLYHNDKLDGAVVRWFSNNLSPASTRKSIKWLMLPVSLLLPSAKTIKIFQILPFLITVRPKTCKRFPFCKIIFLYIIL